jgi:hypothetical protein
MIRYGGTLEQVQHHDVNCNVRFSAGGHERKVTKYTREAWSLGFNVMCGHYPIYSAERKPPPSGLNEANSLKRKTTQTIFIILFFLSSIVYFGQLSSRRGIVFIHISSHLMNGCPSIHATIL